MQCEKQALHGCGTVQRLNNKTLNETRQLSLINKKKCFSDRVKNGLLRKVHGTCPLYDYK